MVESVLWLVLYLAGWAGILAAMIYGITQGGCPSKVLYGVDYKGENCTLGQKVAFPALGWTAYKISLSGSDPATLLSNSPRMCVSSCADTLDSVKMLGFATYNSSSGATSSTIF